LRAPGSQTETLARRPLLTAAYFSDEFTEVKLVLRGGADAVNGGNDHDGDATAIRQYSMAVAPGLIAEES